VAEAAAELEASRNRALIVTGPDGTPRGIVTIHDVERALLDNKPGATLEEVASRPVLTAFADESLSQAIQRMGVRDLGQLPVVTRSQPPRVIGLLWRVDVVAAYSRAMLQRLEAQRGAPVPLHDLHGTRLVEVVVRKGDPLTGRRLSELAMPADVLVVTVLRQQQTIIPRGDTQLLAGDRLMVLVQDRTVADLHEHLAALGNSRALWR
jgi:CBS domain-containing protein